MVIGCCTSTGIRGENYITLTGWIEDSSIGILMKSKYISGHTMHIGLQGLVRGWTTSFEMHMCKLYSISIYRFLYM